MINCNYATWTSWCHKSLANRVCSASYVIEHKIKMTKSPVAGVFLKQRASNVESVPISWFYHIMRLGWSLYKLFDTIAKAKPILSALVYLRCLITGQQRRVIALEVEMKGPAVCDDSMWWLHLDDKDETRYAIAEKVDERLEDWRDSS